VIDEVYRGAGRRLQNLLDDDLPKGQTDLARRIASLELYAGQRPDFASGGGGGSSGVVPTSASANPPRVEEKAGEGS
jgi:hypothetical protein